MSLNKAVITGKLLEDPETRYTNSDEAVTRLLIETGENVKLKVACWRALSEQAKNLKIDDIVIVVGSLITSSYKTNTGLNRQDFEVNAREIYQLSSIPQSLNPIAANNKAANSGSSPAVKETKLKNTEEDLSDVLLSEEEIPF